ncbi:hypothetical protein [Sporosarcina sp. OR05]|uniref:hypothetical protein n=1 Tax=Sporosarcina sp. OR05 TaxID=2969819 RepID=UPI00352A5A3D
MTKDEYLAKLKTVKLAEAGIDIDRAADYTKFIAAEDEDEIERAAWTIAADVTRKANYVDAPIDKNTWTPFK